MKIPLSAVLLVLLILGPVGDAFSGNFSSFRGGRSFSPSINNSGIQSRGSINPSGLLSRGSFRREAAVSSGRPAGRSSRPNRFRRPGFRNFPPFFGFPGPTYIPYTEPPPPEEPEREKPPKKNWPSAYDGLKKTQGLPKASTFNHVYRVGNYFTNTVPETRVDDREVLAPGNALDVPVVPGGLIQLHPIRNKIRSAD